MSSWDCLWPTRSEMPLLVCPKGTLHWSLVGGCFSLRNDILRCKNRSFSNSNTMSLFILLIVHLLTHLISPLTTCEPSGADGSCSNTSTLQVWESRTFTEGHGVGEQNSILVRVGIEYNIILSLPCPGGRWLNAAGFSAVPERPSLADALHFSPLDVFENSPLIPNLWQGGQRHPLSVNTSDAFYILR